MGEDLRKFVLIVLSLSMAVHVEAIGANDGEESLDPEVGPVGAAAADLTGTKAAVGPEAFDRIK